MWFNGDDCDSDGADGPFSLRPSNGCALVDSGGGGGRGCMMGRAAIPEFVWINVYPIVGYIVVAYLCV